MANEGFITNCYHEILKESLNEVAVMKLFGKKS